MTYLVINAFDDSLLNAVHHGAAAIRELCEGDVTVDVDGVTGLRDAIRARPPLDITSLLIYSHGSPGVLHLRTSALTSNLHEDTLWQLSELGDLSDRFAPDAHVEILGCNVAGHTVSPGATEFLGRIRTRDFGFLSPSENARCELFLSHLAAALLATNGGTLTAYTGYGISSLGHPDGHPVTVRHRLRLGLFFDHAVVLRETPIRRGIASLEDLLSIGTRVRERLAGRDSTLTATEALQHFRNAETLIGVAGGDGEHDCRTVYAAFCEYATGAEQALSCLSASFGNLDLF